MTIPEFQENSIASIAFNRFRTQPDRTFLKAMYKNGRFTGSWRDFSYGDIGTEVAQLASAWTQLGLQPTDRVAIMARNRPRWITTVLSLYASNLTLIPIYATLTTEEATYILNDSGAKYLVVDRLEQAQEITAVWDQFSALEHIYVMDGWGSIEDEGVTPYDDLLKLGAANHNSQAIYDTIAAITPEGMAIIMYTSGTTGRPKGVQLTNGNILSQRVALKYFDFTQEDIFLNHLPFSHGFGMTADLLGCLLSGGTLALARSMKPSDIRSALNEVRPTVLISVPRLFEKIFVEVQKVISRQSSLVQRLFDATIHVAEKVEKRRAVGKSLSMKLTLQHEVAEFLLQEVRHQAGLENVRFAIVGGGPISPDLCQFFMSLGVPIYQGYGLTETSPISNVNVPGRNRLGTVGPILEGVEEKIAEDGEILVRGANVMQGYYNLPEATAEALDANGWFHTGDIGYIDDDSYLHITDRKKDLIITSGGKNVAPLAIESAFNTDAYIEMVIVVGDARKYLSALVIPNFDTLRPWAEEQGVHWQTDADLVQTPEVMTLMQASIDRVNDTLARYEQIKTFAIIDHTFTEATGELTATQKVKRRVVQNKYKDIIDTLYPSDTPSF